jgi:hypothetical protein
LASISRCRSASGKSEPCYGNLAETYEQYLAFRRVREAARVNLEQQFESYRVQRPTLYLNVLQAISDWGNAVSQENLYLSLYNTELANLERETGTILETHGVRFVEERYRSIGPLGRHFAGVFYPRASRPGPNEPMYPVENPTLPEPPVPALEDGSGGQIEDLYAPATVQRLPPTEEVPSPPPIRIEIRRE